MIVPTGTVTFLFTDIEGSTKLWEAHPEAMRVALARHDALLRETIEAQGGYIFKTIGDAFCAAFHEAPEALAATLDSQLALILEFKEGDVPIKVRMALHTGAVESRNNDYFGQPVNRVARLLSIGYGGQTILSQSTYHLVRDTLPLMTTLVDLGEHRLKDLAQSEQIFQVRHPDLPDQFPPLKSLGNANNLPQQVTSFIGREKELTEVRERLTATKLLTLTGAGGSGKSRLALQAAADMLDTYPDGAFLVELAPLADSHLVAPTVAHVLKVAEEPGTPLLVTLATNLKEKKLLLLLDNCEHVLDDSAKLADALLKNCPGITIVATSREGLGIAGEFTYRVPSLSLPDPKLRQTADSLAPFESVQLFVARAMQARPNFAVTDANAPSLASICHRLDGIPLALELAAARTRSLSVEDINTKLDQRFRLLTGGSRTALPRQQTLRSLIDWSYDLLGEAEKALLCRLSVFVGGWTLDACEAVCANDLVEEWEILDLLTSLCDKSLAVAEPSGTSTRYRLLETVRQYARDRLLESGEGKTYRDQHLAYVVARVEESKAQGGGRIPPEWLRHWEEELDNVRAVLAWAVDEDPEAGLRIAAPINLVWRNSGYVIEGRNWIADLLERCGANCPPAVRGQALSTLGHLSHVMGYDAEAIAYFDASILVHHQIGDKAKVADALSVKGSAVSRGGDLARGAELAAEGLALLREVGDTLGTCIALGNLGGAYLIMGRLDQAKAHYEEELILARSLGRRDLLRNPLTNLAIIARYYKDFVLAKRYCDEAFAIAQESGDRVAISHELVAQAEVAVDGKNYVEAKQHLVRLTALWREMGKKKQWCDVLFYAARVALALNGPNKAARLFGANERLREETGEIIYPTEAPDYEEAYAQVRAAFADDAALAKAWEEGRHLSRDQAVDYALS